MDLYLIHAPWAWDQRGQSRTTENIQAWKAMEQLLKEGKIRSIGVSNFNVDDLKAIISACEIVSMVNQIRFSVGFTQDEIVQFCQSNNILIEAYSPLGTGSVFQNEELKAIALRNNVSVAQLCIKYCLEKGTLPLPKTRSKDRMVENASLDFVLSAKDSIILDGIKEIERL